MSRLQCCGRRSGDSMNNYNDANNLDPRKGEEVSGKSVSVAWPSQKGGLYGGLSEVSWISMWHGHYTG